MVPEGYLPDYGEAFGDRGNGFSYGWSRDITADARDRDVANSPDQRYDTFIHFQKGEAAVWEIVLPERYLQSAHRLRRPIQHRPDGFAGRGRRHRPGCPPVQWATGMSMT